MSLKSTKISYDRMGMITAIGCAIHCTVLPVLISSLPLMGLDVLKHKSIEWTMIMLAFVFGMLSFHHGWNHHHKRIPVFLFCIGFMLLFLNQLSDERLVYLLIPVSASCVITAHSLNVYYCRKLPHRSDI